MTIYLVRHGRAEAGVEHPDPGLDDVGRSQAERAAGALKKTGATRSRSAHRSGARARRLRPSPRPSASHPSIRDEVSEVFDPSLEVGARRDMLIPLLSGRWSEQPEVLRRWRERVLDAFVALGSDKVVVVSHFVAISVAIGASTEDDRVSPCALANASITTMEVVAGGLHLRRPGEVSHLSRDEITATHAAIGRR